MFSKNNAYYYEQPQEELFERELPFKSLKLPYHTEKTKVLKHTQKKYEIEQLRQQIMKCCKFEELEYLEMLKKQREIMEQDIKRRKMLIDYRMLEQRIGKNQPKNNKNSSKIRDSLQDLQQEHSRMKNTIRKGRVETALQLPNIQNNKRKPVSGSLELTDKEMDIMLKIKKQNAVKNYDMWKEQQIKRIKQSIVENYKFGSEAKQKPLKEGEISNQTEQDWWVNKVKVFYEKQKEKEGKKKLRVNQKHEEKGLFSSEESQQSESSKQ